MNELLTATRACLDGESHQPRIPPHPYAFNLFSHDTEVDPQSGYNEEEAKVIAESRKILGDPDIRVGVTCVCVPVLRAHAIALTIECEHPIEPQTRTRCCPARRASGSSMAGGDIIC